MRELIKECIEYAFFPVFMAVLVFVWIATSGYSWGA